MGHRVNSWNQSEKEQKIVSYHICIKKKKKASTAIQYKKKKINLYCKQHESGSLFTKSYGFPYNSIFYN